MSSKHWIEETTQNMSESQKGESCCANFDYYKSKIMIISDLERKSETNKWLLLLL